MSAKRHRAFLVFALVSSGLLLLSLLAGCSLFRGNPLAQHHGAIVLVINTRTAGDLKSLRRTLAEHDARATVFAGGQVTRGLALSLHDLRDDGHEIGLSGLKGVDPQAYSRMYGQQKYFTDEIVTQMLDARRFGLNPHYYLLGSLALAKADTLTLPDFLVSKGFTRVVHKMPVSIPPRAKPAAELTSPVLHVYTMTQENFDRAQIAALARHDEVLVVSPTRQALSDLLDEACANGVPFATLTDLELMK